MVDADQTDQTDQIRRDLRRLRAVQRKRAELEAEFIDLAVRLRGYSPPVPFRRIGEAAGMSDVGIINALKRAGRATQGRSAS